MTRSEGTDSAPGNAPAQGRPRSRRSPEEIVANSEGIFSRVVFAIGDWSEDRRFLGLFRDAFGPA